MASRVPALRSYSAPRLEQVSPATVAAPHVERLLEGLNPQQRAAVVLRFYEDMSFAEIGRVLGCPDATARSHVHRALASLRTLMEEGDSHD